jgi:hypothetical protein
VDVYTHRIQYLLKSVRRNTVRWKIRRVQDLLREIPVKEDMLKENLKSYYS